MSSIERTICKNEATWLEARRNGIGASEAAAILGASKYETATSLYLAKLGLTAPDAARSDLMARLQFTGHLMEPVIETLYARERPEARIIVAPPPFTIYRNAEFPAWMTCTPDRLIADGGVSPVGIPLELKNVDFHLGLDWQEEPPLGFIIQLQHQMAVLGADVGVLAALVGGNSFRWVEFQRDDEFIDGVLVPALARFMYALTNQIQPAADDSERTREALKLAYPLREPGKSIPLPASFFDWDAKRQSAIKAIKELEGLKREAESNILREMGDADLGVLPNGVVYSNRSQKRGTTTFRVFRRKGLKGEDDDA